MLADSVLHETRERWQNIDRRINAFPMKCSAENDLAFGDIARQVRHRMRDVVAGHSQDWDLRYGSRPAVHAAAAFEDLREIRIEIARIRLASRNLIAS